MSIYIDKFFMSVDDTAVCTSLVDFSVDVYDLTYGVTASGTYFIYNGTVVSGTYTTISGGKGYHISYPTTPSGDVVLGLRVQNGNNDVVLNEYEFDYGYNVVWNEVTYWDVGIVPVTILASNNVITPSKLHYSTFFSVRTPSYNDLLSEISTDGSGGSDLGTSIIPQSKYFEYGKSFEVTIEGVKDFSGNLLPPVTYTFKIEDE